MNNGKAPACISGKCPIVDIAGSRRLNRLCDAFLQVEILDQSSGYGSFQDKIIRDSGLSEESAETILEMRQVLAEYREWKSRQNKGGK